ncbi:MAG: hypothetical protein ACK42I_07525 [Thermomicrobium sp.]
MHEERDQEQPNQESAPEALQENGQRPVRRPSRTRSASSEVGESEQVSAASATEAPKAESASTLELPPATIARAEQLLDEALVWGAAVGTVVARRARRLMARVREEVEDLIAEAEAVRSQWRQQFRQRRTPPEQ